MTQCSEVRATALRRSIAVAIALVVLAGCSANDATAPSASPSPTGLPAATTTGSTAVTSSAEGSTGSAPGRSAEVSVSTPASGAPAYAAALQASLQDIVDPSTVPSAVVIVRSGQFGDVTYTFGTTEIGGSVPVSTTDHARVGSITKTMTATVILQLVQEGLIGLDDPVSAYVPTVPGGDGITIAQLLEMRSGLYNYTDDPDWVQDNEDQPARVWQPQELLDVAFAHPPLYAPGANWNYSNTNYILLGMIMEQLTGQTAAELFEERLFAPLGMHETSLPALADSSIPEPFAHGYHYGSFDKALPPDEQAQAAAGTLLPADVSLVDNPSWGWTAGSVISTAEDQLLWIDALVDGTLLDAPTQQLRLDSIQGLGPDFPEAEGRYEYGYGIDRRLTYDGHGGQITGYNSAVARDPATDTDIVVITTLTLGPDGTSVANALLYAVIEGLPNGGAMPDLPLETGDQGP